MDTWLESRPSPAEHVQRRQARAVWFRRPHEVELRDEVLDPPGPSDIHVRALRSAISHGTEILVYRGQVDSSLPLDLPTLKGSFQFPIKYGYASVGRVEEVGKSVAGINEGDLVFVHHPHQSEYVVPAASAIGLSKDIDPEIGVFLANLETAVNIAVDAQPRIGARAVVFGQGVVGLLVTQLLRRAGISVFAVDPIEKRRQLAVAVGAEVALQPDETLTKQLMDRTDGDGAELAVELSGNPAALGQAIDCVGFQGTVVAASWYGKKPVTLDLGGRFHRNRVRIVSSQVSHVDPRVGPTWTVARRTQVARDILGQVTLAPLISHRFALEEAADAYRMLDERPDEAVQAVFTYV